MSPSRIFSANFKSAVVERLRDLGVDQAYWSCACLGLEGSQGIIQRLGGLSVVFIDSFGGFRKGVLRILECMVRLRLLRPSPLFLCFAVSRRGKTNADGDREVDAAVLALLTEAGFRRANPCRCPAYVQQRYGSMRVYAYRGLCHKRRPSPSAKRSRADKTAAV